MDRATTTPSGAPLRRPGTPDGIVSAQRPRGWLGDRWLQCIQSMGSNGKSEADQQSRLARGRTLARAGKVRDLWFAPGLASAEVTEKDTHTVSLRVRVFSDGDWNAVVQALLDDLRHIASLLEGDLTSAFVEALDGRSLSLLPLPKDISGDCNCLDYVSPCAHMAAAHHCLADALDGDPFTLLTLRGRTRDQLLAALRKAWGDPEPIFEGQVTVEEDPPDGDWTAAPDGIGAPHIRIRESGITAVGLRALGPPPGGETDLVRVLAPLYEAGAKVARDIAWSDVPAAGSDESNRFRAQFRQARSASEAEFEEMKRTPTPAPPPDGTDGGHHKAGYREDLPLTERLVNLLAERESAKSAELADALHVDLLEIRNELLELEKLGIVYRTGQTRGTKWWLG